MYLCKDTNVKKKKNVYKAIQMLTDILPRCHVMLFEHVNIFRQVVNPVLFLAVE